MTLINGDKIVTAQLYDDEHEEFTEKKMSIIDYVNAYTNEGVTTADDVLDKIRAEIDEIPLSEPIMSTDRLNCYGAKSISIGHFREKVFEIIDKYIDDKDLKWKMENCCCIGGDRE